MHDQAHKMHIPELPRRPAPRVVAGTCACVSTAAVANDAASVGSLSSGAAPSSVSNSDESSAESESSESEEEEEDEDDEEDTGSSSGDEADSDSDTGMAVLGAINKYMF